MRKMILVVFTSALTSILLVGCQLEDNTSLKTETNHNLRLEDNKKLQLNGEIKKISISKSKGSNETVFDNEEDLKIFRTIILSVVKEKGIVNMAEPEFYLDVIDETENKQSFYLWIGDKGQKSTLMRTDNTYTIYTVSEEMTNKLIDLVE